MRLIARIASRFGVVVSEKATAEAVRIVGAAGDATVNLLFINHFQSMPGGHFIIRSLERKWGGEVVKRNMKELQKKGHTDHSGALSELKSKLRIPVGTHRLDANDLALRPEIFLSDGERVSFGNISLKVLHTPGHTPGSLGFLIGKHLISGDTIFPGSPGKTKSPADLKRIIESKTRKIFVLPDDTEVCPGHVDSPY